jgi:MarR family transcriptional regulator, 2-MHQ and catechol-resistance regulon repressor
VAHKLLLSTGNITTVLQNLQKRGLISRERDANDQRYIQVSLAQKGRALVEEILPAHIATIVSDLSILTAGEQEALACLCRQLVLRLPSSEPSGRG